MFDIYVKCFPDFLHRFQFIFRNKRVISLNDSALLSTWNGLFSRCWLSTQRPPPPSRPAPPPSPPPHRCSIWRNTGKGNIFLMGSPGSGKTSLAQLVGSKLGMPYLDIDDDYLEKHWNTTVAEKLSSVGSERFVLEEGEATILFETHNSIVSLTGSNPLHLQAMQHLQKLGIIIYLDVPHADILHRLDKMKVDRIVGQTDGIPLSDILKYREEFYEKYYDIRVICGESESLESIANKITVALTSFDNITEYVSTRGHQELGFNDIVLQGLANDGGLFVPSKALPRLGNSEWMRLVPLDYRARAIRILEMLIHPRDIHPLKLRQYVDSAFTDDKFKFGVCRVVPAADNPRSQVFLELFHGPTGSFKDLALQLMPYIFHHAIQSHQQSKSRYLLLVATSGDTGSAVAHGFSSFVADGDSHLKILVLYPENGVSNVQKLQMLSAQNENVSIVGVDGDFDFCQTTVKTLLSDLRIARQLFDDFNIRLSAANSINWARLVAQILFHVSGYLDIVKQNIIHIGQEVDVAIPTGNFGNLMSAIYAKKMGIPIRKLICASNSNNILTEFINTGSYNLGGRHLVRTTSPAIDILISSNLERYIQDATNSAEFHRLYQQLDKTGRFKASSQLLFAMRNDFWADWCMETSCLDSIHDTFKQTGYLIDPHTAVAVAVSKKFASYRGMVPLVVCATAHYAKFPSTVLHAVNRVPASDNPSELFRTLESLNPNPPMHHKLKNDLTFSNTPHIILPPDLPTILSHIKSMF